MWLGEKVWRCRLHSAMPLQPSLGTAKTDWKPRSTPNLRICGIFCFVSIRNKMVGPLLLTMFVGPLSVGSQAPGSFSFWWSLWLAGLYHSLHRCWVWIGRAYIQFCSLSFLMSFIHSRQVPSWGPLSPSNSCHVSQFYGKLELKDALTHFHNSDISSHPPNLS